MALIAAKSRSTVSLVYFSISLKFYHPLLTIEDEILAIVFKSKEAYASLELAKKPLKGIRKTEAYAEVNAEDA